MHGPSPDLRYASATLSTEGRGGASLPGRREGATITARRLRSDETEAEYRRWGELRNRQLNGHKFVRQMPIGPYFADFVCRAKRLVVELDGFQHAGSAHDVLRTNWLNAQGYSVLRFWNHEVLQERRAILETILSVLERQIVVASSELRFSPAAQRAASSPLGERSTRSGG
ncbi:endonuclease domain-containing protein [Georhizobium profundi]|nr:endonuclease domain-containing protein [Georhizobium profundi]